MGFLARYWNAVEKAVSETGSNPGDIKIDLATLFKNTGTTNTVVTPNASTSSNHKTHPNQDGNMFRHANSFEARQDRARRAARRSQSNERLEERYRKETPRKTDRVENDRTQWGTRTGHQVEDPQDKRSKHHETLIKLGGGYTVNVVLAGVTIDGVPTW